MQVKGLGLSAVKRTAVLNHTASDVPVQVAPAMSGYFDWPSGTFTAPAHGGLPIMVTFEGGDAASCFRLGADRGRPGRGIHGAGHRRRLGVWTGQVAPGRGIRLIVIRYGRTLSEETAGSLTKQAHTGRN